ncbi:MAG: gliding motility protein GldL [Culturomica sp.]|jgi:ABC-type transporter Mla subunit MlaD|nr:gliding motility protein GldL [Culturomica sp.]
MAKFFQTKAYQTVIGYVYGWGASAVIVGALFKIMHFPGAGAVLTVGMLVEALIFFVSAFEPSPEHYDWARVFPELSGHGEQPAAARQRHGAGTAGHSQGASGTAGLDEADVSRLKEGISKFVKSADSFAEASVNVPDFTRKVNNAAASFERLGEKGEKAGELLENSIGSFTDGYNELNRILKDSSGQLTSQIKANCEKLAATMGTSSDGFGALNKIMEEQLLQVKAQAENYTQQIAGVNKNISALNALYELQVNETKDCLESFRGMQSDMGEMLENVSLSLDSTKLFKQEAQQLANSVSSLNAVYGNMLSVIDNN